VQAKDAVSDVRQYIDAQEFQAAVGELEYLLGVLKNHSAAEQQVIVDALVREFETIVSSGGRKLDEALSHIGNTFMKEGYFDAAEIFYQHSLDQNRGNIFSTSGIGRCYFCRGEYRQAMKWFRKSQKINPDDRYVKNKIADAYVGLGELDTALELMLELRASYSDQDSYIAKRIGDVYLRQERFEEAQQIYETVDQAVDDRYDLAAYGLGMCYSHFGQIDKFKEVLRTFLDCPVINPRHLNDMANYCYQFKMYDEALTCAVRSIKIDPDNHIGWYWFANACRKLKKYILSIRACNLLLVQDLENEQRRRVLTCKGYAYLELYRADPNDNNLYVTSKMNLEAAVDGYGWAAAGLVFLSAVKYEFHAEYQIEMMAQIERFMWLGNIWAPESKDVGQANLVYQSILVAFERKYGRFIDYSLPNEEESYAALEAWWADVRESPKAFDTTKVTVEDNSDASKNHKDKPKRVVIDLTHVNDEVDEDEARQEDKIAEKESNREVFDRLMTMLEDAQVDKTEFTRMLVQLTILSNGDLDREYVDLAYRATKSNHQLLAEKLYLNALIVNPENAIALAALASIKRQKKDFTVALILARQAHAVEPRDLSYWRNFVLTLFASERYEEAIVECEQLLIFDKKYNLTLRVQLAKAYEDCERWGDAADLYDNLYERTGHEKYFEAVQRCFPNI